MQLNSSIIRCIIILAMVMMSAILFCSLNYTGDKIEPGDQFIIINPVYLVGVYKNLNNRQISNKTALGYLDVHSALNFMVL